MAFQTIIYIYIYIYIYNKYIPARNIPFNFFVVCDKLEPNTIYKFTVGNIVVSAGETETFDVVVKDKLTNEVDFIRNFEVGKNATLFFSTGDDTTEKELRIYSRQVGKTNNISLKIGFCQLVKILLEDK